MQKIVEEEEMTGITPTFVILIEVFYEAEDLDHLLELVQRYRSERNLGKIGIYMPSFK